MQSIIGLLGGEYVHVDLFEIQTLPFADEKPPLEYKFSQYSL